MTGCTARSALVVVIALAAVTGAVAPAVGTVVSTPADGAGTADTAQSDHSVADPIQEGPVVVEPSELEFGEVPVGEQLQGTVEVRNEGDTAVEIDRREVNIDGDFLSFGIEATGIPTSLGPGESASIPVTFTPQSAGPKQLDVEVPASNGQTLTMTLTGAGVSNETGGNLTVEPGGLFLGEVAVGEESSSELTLRNTGVEAVDVESFRVTGRNAEMYSIDGEPLTLEGGESETVEVTFAPTSAGPAGANLTIRHSAGDPIEVGLVGAASGPNLLAEPSPVDFGTVNSGAEETRTVTIRNDGDGAASIDSVRVVGDDASQFSTEADVGTLDGGDATEIEVNYVPDQHGPQRATLLVRPEDESLAPLRVPLRGDVRAPDITVEPRSLQFGEATVGEEVVREFTIANDGEAPLEVDNVTVLWPRDVFETDASTPLTVPVDGERTVSVTFEPDRARTFSGTLRVATNDPTQSQVPIWLTNSDTTVEMSVREEEDTTQVNMSVENVDDGENVSMSYSTPDPDENASINGISAEVETGGNFTMNVTSSEEPQDTTPEFEPAAENGTELLNTMSIQHSIPNEDIEEATVEISVNKDRLAELEATDPEDVEVYRFDEDREEWVVADADFRRETDTHLIYEASADGFSEWATGAQQAQFEVVQADVSVSTITTGDSVNVNVRIENTGGADGEFLTELLLDQDVVDERSVDIAAGGTAQVTFDRSFDQPGDYSVRVNDVLAGDVTVSQSETNEDGTSGDDETDSDQGTSGDEEAEQTTSGTGDALSMAFVTLIAGLSLLARARLRS